MEMTDPFTIYIHRIPKRVFGRMLQGEIGNYICHTWGGEPEHFTFLSDEDLDIIYTIFASKSPDYIQEMLYSTYKKHGLSLKALNGKTKREIIEWFFTHDYNRLKKCEEMAMNL